MSAPSSVRHHATVRPNHSRPLTRTPGGPANQPPEILAFFAEAERLIAEAAERFEAGSLLAALSSLVAMPPIHQSLVERCVELLEPADGDEVIDGAPTIGMYL
jgi:hypothetical protein